MTPRNLADLVVKMAVENPRWGYTRIRGALTNLRHEIARNTVKRILLDHGIEPAPERSRRTPWKPFLQAHWAG
jgi:putative transposase